MPTDAGSMETDLGFYRTHSRWSDPGRRAILVAEIAPTPESVARVVAGLVSHPFLAPMRNIQVPASAAGDYWVGRTVEEIIDQLLARNGRPLTEARSPAQRFFGCCRHYALMATSVFRTHGIPARCRVGFAAYFNPGSFEDHWVCEYWNGTQWHLLDAELDETALSALGIQLAPWDVPRDQFLDAATAWRRLRAGEIDPARVGISVIGLAGTWFAAANVIRDVGALNKEEMLPWDCWGAAREFVPARDLPRDHAERIDEVAAWMHGTPGAALAQRVYHEREWLRLTPTVLSFSKGVATEVDVSRSA